MAILNISYAAALLAALPLCFGAPTNTTTIPAKFLLKTRTTVSGNQSVNDYYLWSQHTGAGISKTVLYKDKSAASKCSLNGAMLNVELAPGVSSGLFLDTSKQPTASEPVAIQPAGLTTSGFFIESGALMFGGPNYTPQHPVIDPNNLFGGWLACQGSPMTLTYVSNAALNNNKQIPASCSEIGLYVEATS